MKLLQMVAVWLVSIAGGEMLSKQEEPVVTPVSYKLRLQPIGHEHYRGQVHINVSCVQVTDTIVLHAHSDIHVELADTVIHSVTEYEKSSFRRMEDSHHYRRIPPSLPLHSVAVLKLKRDKSRDLCEIMLNDKLKKGMMYQLKLEFSGNMSTDPFYQEYYEDHGTREKRWFMAIDLTSHKGRRVFPCFDEKHFKANFEVSIVRPEKMRTISTTPLSSTESVIHRAGWKIDYFKRTPPLSVDSLSVVIFDPRSLLPVPPRQISGGITIRGYAHSSLFNSFQHVVDKVGHMVEEMQSYSGVPFPLPELHLLAVPQSNSSRNFWGLIIFSDKILAEDFFNSVIPKYIVDQWTEHLMTPSSVEDEDLAIGLKVYLIYNILRDIMTIKDMINMKALFERLLFYDLGFTDPAHRNLSRHKAMLSAMAIRMLNYTLTENTLKKALHSFMLDRSYKVFTEDDFFDAVDNQAWLDGVLPVAMSTRDIARSWTERRRFPVVTVTRNYGNNTATFEQHPYLREWPHAALDESRYSWWVPLMFLTRNSLTVNPFMTFGWMKNKKFTITYMPHRETFIIVNPENIGLFMVNYDQTNWHLLSEYLCSQRDPQIPAGTRSKLLYDAVYLAENGELDYSVALEVTRFVRHERDPLVWHTVYDVFDELKRIVHDTPAFHKLLLYMRYMFTPAYESLKSELEPDSLLAAGYEPLIASAKAEFQGKLRNNAVLDMPEGSLCSVFRWSQEDWDLALTTALQNHKVKRSDDQSFLLLSKLVACTNNPDNINRVLSSILLNSNSTFTTAEIDGILESVVDYPTFIKFISNHWMTLESLFGTKPHIWNKMFEEATKDMKTQEGLELVSQLYHIFRRKLGSAQKIVESSLQKIKLNVYEKYKCISVIDAWLDRQLLTLSIQG